MDNETDKKICAAAARGLNKILPGGVPEHVNAAVMDAAAKHARSIRRTKIAKLVGTIAAAAAAVAIIAGVQLRTTGLATQDEHIDTFMALVALTTVDDYQAFDGTGDAQISDEWALVIGEDRQEFDTLADSMLRMQESAMLNNNMYAYY